MSVKPDQDKEIVEIRGNITYNRTFTCDKIYVIVGEVNVLPGVTIIIENKTLFYIRNGIYPNSRLRKSCLIFQTGSSLYAEDIYFVSSNECNKRTIVRDNAGVWFLGSVEAEKEGIYSYYSVIPSSFNAHEIFTYYLGSIDPPASTPDGEPSTDNDSLTILGCNSNEWNISNIFIQESGDNALDVILSNVVLKNIEILHPGEDAINLQSAHLTVTDSLKLYVPLTEVYDRDIFDFETDNGPSWLKINRYCYVEILGIFGDQLDLVSIDLPQPTETLYYYNNVTNNGDSYIYSGRIIVK
jgi:hypothetical protein